MTAFASEQDGTLPALPYRNIVGVPGLHLIRGPGTHGNLLMRRHADRLRRIAKTEGRRVHINTTGNGSLLVSVR